MPKLLSVSLLPPAAVARLGSSSRPLENYEWRTDPSVHGGALTVIEPATSLDVADDGTVAPYRPGVIRFRDGRALRPVAPFFEIWARVVYVEADRTNGLIGPTVDISGTHEVPLTATLLRAAGGALSGVSFTVSVANRKAARRTGDDANLFEAIVRVRADDHQRHSLLAITPPRPGQTPLVGPERPILLGTFQVLRPARRNDLDVDLDVLRARFTPARGQVYGPPSAVEAIGTTLRETFEIVPPDNRLLNPASTWLTYDADYARFNNPEPSDTYDGADQDQGVSWGVVDDTCDGTVAVSVIVNGQAYGAVARVFVGPPDYAPDRRPFLSLADDLTDRDRDPPVTADLKDGDLRGETMRAVTDLFQRAFETASLLNVDPLRRRALGDNDGVVPSGSPSLGRPPYVDQRSMTPADKGYADARIDAIVPDAPSGTARFTPLVSLAHEPLAIHDELVAFLRNDPDRVRRMLRPPYASFAELLEAAPADTAPDAERRDPRTARDTAHDMRMPPYMRDEMARALSLTRRQYLEILALVDELARTAKPVAPQIGLAPSSVGKLAAMDWARAAGAAPVDLATSQGLAAAPERTIPVRPPSAVLTDEHSAVRQRVRAVLARAQAGRGRHTP